MSEFSNHWAEVGTVLDGFRRRGVRRLFVKHLAPNDIDEITQEEARWFAESVGLGRFIK